MVAKKKSKLLFSIAIELTDITSIAVSLTRSKMGVFVDPASPTTVKSRGFSTNFSFCYTAPRHVYASSKLRVSLGDFHT